MYVYMYVHACLSPIHLYGCGDLPVNDGLHPLPRFLDVLHRQPVSSPVRVEHLWFRVWGSRFGVWGSPPTSWSTMFAASSRHVLRRHIANSDPLGR